MSNYEDREFMAKMSHDTFTDAGGVRHVEPGDIVRVVGLRDVSGDSFNVEYSFQDGSRSFMPGIDFGILFEEVA